MSETETPVTPMKTGTPNLNKALSQLQGELPRIKKTKTGKVEGENKAGKHFSYDYCVSPETRILTHDLRWVEAHKLAEGDSLVAFDEMPPSGVRCRRWRSAGVQAVKWVTQPTYRIYLADGTELTASATHRWLVMDNGQFMTWADTKDLRAPGSAQYPMTSAQRTARYRSRQRGEHVPVKRGGPGPSHLVRAVDMWPEALSYETGYLAAAFDGEGSLVQTPVKRADGLAPREQTYQLHCVFAQRDNEMRRQVDALLAHFGFSVQHGQLSGTNSDVHNMRIAGGRPEVLRFLGQVRPVRLLSNFTADHLGTLRCKERVAVDAVEFLGEQPLVAAQTSTRTFIAEGFASHNSYADLGDVVADIGPLLAKFGLAFHCGPTINPADRREMILVWALLHESGEEKTGEWPLGPVNQKPQSLGSAITYGRRYSFTAATNIVLEDDDDGQRAQQDHRQSAAGAWDNATPAPRKNGQQRGQVSRPEQPRPAAETDPEDIDSDAQAYADEAHQALIVRDVEDIHKRAREAGKVAASVRNPSSSGIGKLAVYLDWRRKQLKEVDDALADLTAAAKERDLDDIEGYVKSVVGTDLDSATAAQMRTAAKTLRERKPVPA